MKYLIHLLLFCSFGNLLAQPNCEAFKYKGEMKKYEACKKAEGIEKYNQFTKEYQTILDESIKIDSTFAYAYREKSTAYLKSGDFVTWKKLIDKAVKFNFEDNLGYRGWCRYQFFRDYKGAIQDIERLDSLVKYDIGHSINGTYHLNIAKGLCYKAIGEKEKAIQIIESQIKLNKEEDFVGTYDYLHLGVLYFEINKFKKALETFQKQSVQSNLSENQFYAALAYKALSNKTMYKESLKKAKKLYLTGHKMNDGYSNPMDKIFLSTIEGEMKTTSDNN